MKHTAAVCEQLLRSGANVNAADNRGATPILVCCASGRYIQYSVIMVVIVCYNLLSLVLI